MAEGANDLGAGRASERQVDWKTRIAFGLGSFAEGIKGGAFNFLLLFYYNQVLGLSGGLSGIALAVAVLFDAITDPLAGSLSDGHRSRWGRRHPFMYGAAIPFALVFYLVFNPPAGLDQMGLFAWLLVFAVAARGALTLYAVPHMALSAEMSTNHRERTTLSAVRTFFSVGGSITVLLMGFGVFFRAGDGFDNGQLNPANYPPFARAAALTMASTILLSALGTHHLIPRLPQAEAGGTAFSLGRVLREMGQALRVRPFRFLLGALIANSAVTGVLLALSLYVLTYFWKLEGIEVFWLLSAGLGGSLLSPLAVTHVAHWLGEKRLGAMIGLAWFALLTAAMVTARLFGLAPADGDPLLLPLILSGSVLGGIGMGVANILKYSMLADVTDEHERVYGVRQEGIYYSSVSFAYKATSGLGTLLAGVAIDLVGLVPGSDPATVSPLVVESLGWVYGPFTMLLIGVPIALLWRYDITEERHAEIRREIEARKAEPGG